MAVALLILNLLYLLSNLISLGAHGVKIQFNRHANFTGRILESNSRANCNNIPQNKITDAIYIRTDTCFIAYWNPDCKSWNSEKFMPGDIDLSSRSYMLIQSFQLCNDEEGGTQLNIDITKDLNNVNLNPDVVERYRNVCSCVNVPQHVKNMDKWCINNHHNALLAYYEPNCEENKWNSIFIPAGHNYFFTDMHQHKKTDSVSGATYKIQSFGPDPNSTYFKNSCNSVDKRREVLTNQIAELQKNQSDMRNEQTAFFAKLTQAFNEHKLEMRNFTEKFKSDLRKLFA